MASFRAPMSGFRVHPKVIREKKKQHAEPHEDCQGQAARQRRLEAPLAESVGSGASGGFGFCSLTQLFWVTLAGVEPTKKTTSLGNFSWCGTY